MFNIKNVKNLTVNITGGKKELSAEDFLAKIFKGPPPPFDKILKDLGGECACVLDFKVENFNFIKQGGEIALSIYILDMKHSDQDIIYKVSKKHFKNVDFAEGISRLEIPIEGNAPCVLNIVFLFLHKCMSKNLRELKIIGKEVMKLDSNLVDSYVSKLNAP